MQRLLVLTLLLVLIGQAQARPEGIGSVGNDGCVCHGGSDDTTTITLNGLPDIYNSSESYNLILTIESPVEQNNPKGGYRVVVSHGAISGETQELDGGYTHTSSTNNQREWNLIWTAPEADDKLATFVIHGNAVNGNGDTSGDEWNSLSMAIPGQNYDGEVEAPDVSSRPSNVQYTVAAIGTLLVISLAVIAIRD